MTGAAAVHRACTAGARAGNGAGHWSDAWLGRPWVEGEYECWDMVVDALIYLGRARPADSAWTDRPRGAGARARARILLAGLRAGRIARPLAPGEPPREGDGLPIRAAGARRPHHTGLLVALTPGAARHVLHCIQGAGVVRHRLDGLAAIGMAPDAPVRFRA